MQFFIIIVPVMYLHYIDSHVFTGPLRSNGHHGKHRRGYETASTVTSSDLESTSFFDSEDDSSR